MKKFENLALILILATIVALGACNSDASEDLPESVSQFTTQYFPGFGVKSYHELSNGGCIVQLSGGPTIMFNCDNAWTEIDGNGALLPQVLMYDQLPPALYEYLQGTEQTDGVYDLKRDKYYYKLIMLDTVLTYDIATEKVSYPGATTK